MPEEGDDCKEFEADKWEELDDGVGGSVLKFMRGCRLAIRFKCGCDAILLSTLTCIFCTGLDRPT